MAAKDQLIQVMWRDIGGHANRNPAGAIGQQVWKGGGHHLGLFEGAIIIGAEIDRVFRQTFHQGLGNRGQARLGITGGGRVIAVDIAEIALPVDQRIALVEILGKAGHGIVNRGVAVGVIIAHDIARDLGRFAEPPRRRQPQFAHREENSAVHRLQPVARIRQGTVHDRGQSIGQIALADGAAKRLGKGYGLYLGVLGRIGHGCCVVRLPRPVQMESTAARASHPGNRGNGIANFPAHRPDFMLNIGA